MRRIGESLCLAVCGLLLAPQLAAAGGSEFPAGGTRDLGRGATGFTRADDPSLMLRNPALLADLWDDMASLGAHFLIPKSCFHATGGYGWNVAGDDISNYGNGPVYLQAPAGATDLNGKPIKGFLDEPYPQVCYRGGVRFLPNVALTMKLSPSVGVGIGFFPPDTAALPEFGNADGTVDTPNGKRPSPTRYFNSHLDTSFFSALGAIGYRPLDWLRVGLGLQWNVIAFSATSWARPTPDLAPHTDVRTDIFGRDLFVPGVIASVQVVPTDNLDFAVGFKWSDRIETKAKLDLTTGAFGTGAPFVFIDAAGHMQAKSSSVPTTSNNQQGTVSAPPLWVPQLSFGARYAQRILPRARTSNWEALHAGAGREVLDHMATERWDIEANAIVYFAGANDRQLFSNDAKNAAMVELVDAQPGGLFGHLPAHVGTCTKLDKNGNCVGAWEVPTEFGGKTQLSVRVGGDYNVVPGLFAMRAGVSYETNGQDVGYLNPTNYQLGRTGLHAGATLRIATTTDVSIGFAHFIQRDIRLDMNPVTGHFPLKYSIDAATSARYNYVPGTHDGIAKVEVPYGDAYGPNFANFGSFFYRLEVLSVTFLQHF
ncbi:MAG: OmpP1/FadL family transporter [Polyangiales bacterium]